MPIWTIRVVLWPPPTNGPGHDGERVGARPRHLFVQVDAASAPRLLGEPDTIAAGDVEFPASAGGRAAPPAGSPSCSLRDIAVPAINRGAR